MKKNDLLTSTKKLRAALALALLTAVIVGAIVLVPAMSKHAAMSTHDLAMAAKIDLNAPNTSPYKNGSYTARGGYNSPGGPETIKVTFKLINGQIATSKLVSGSTAATSASYQALFIYNYKQLVIGKKISNLHLGNVSGSSLTSIGFNKAVKSIEQQAQKSQAKPAAG